MDRDETLSIFPIGSTVILVEPLDQSCMADEDMPPPKLREKGKVTDVGGLLFKDSVFVQFADAIIECDPNWITPASG